MNEGTKSLLVYTIRLSCISILHLSRSTVVETAHRELGEAAPLTPCGVAHSIAQVRIQQTCERFTFRGNMSWQLTIQAAGGGQEFDDRRGCCKIIVSVITLASYAIWRLHSWQTACNHEYCRQGRFLEWVLGLTVEIGGHGRFQPGEYLLVMVLLCACPLSRSWLLIALSMPV